jgi:hypothetical protein
MPHITFKVEIVEMTEKLDCVLSMRAARPYIYGHISTSGGSAAPRVAKPDGVVDGIFP